MRASLPKLGIVLIALASGEARAADGDPLDPERREIAALPLFGGSSDIGIGAGAIAALTQFALGTWPYAWRLELKAFAAGKDAGDGFDVEFHDHHVDLDLTASRRVRVGVQAYFSRDTAAGYWGLGNASPHLPANAPARWEQYRWTTPGLAATLRMSLARPLSIFVGGGGAWHAVDQYAGSKLELDARGGAGSRARSLLTGASGEHGLVSGDAGIAIDTRDHETVPTRGMFHDLSVRGGRAVGETFGFGGVHLTTRFYAPIAGERLVVAARVATDVLFGDPPVYVLASMGGLEPTWAPGGGEAVRGVPYGRYAGRIKTIANLELRSMFLRFRAVEQRLRLGAVAFVDTGRVRAAFEDAPELDGELPGLKVGVGGGARLLWGEAFLIRGDAAWSPDGIGVYFRTDHVF